MVDGPIVIVGASMAGGRAAEAIRAAGYEGPVTLLGDEPVQPCERPPLSKEFLRGEQAISKAFLRPEEWYRENDIELMLDVRAQSVSVRDHTVSLADGAVLPWEKLLFATGARPRLLSAPGGDAPGVLTLRRIEDAIAIADHLKPGARVVVIGAGFIGAEVAASARAMGCEVTLVEMLAAPLQRALGEQVGAVIAQVHRDNGVMVRLGVDVARIQSDTWVRSVELQDGNVLDADVVIAGVGVEPNVELAVDAGVACDDGIIVNEFCETGTAGIFAAGDVANHPNPILGARIRIEHWQNAQNQGAAAGKVMAGVREPFSEVPWFWSDQYDLNIQMAGHPVRWDRLVVRGSLDERKGCVFYLDGDRLVAAVGLNAGKDVRAARTLIAAAITPSDVELADLSTDLRALAKR